MVIPVGARMASVHADAMKGDLLSICWQVNCMKLWLYNVFKHSSHSCSYEKRIIESVELCKRMYV